MKKISLLLGALLCSLTLALAQKEVGYTLVSDRTFNTLEDLIGYDFRPAAMEVPDEGQREIQPGEYSFGISRNNLYVNGPQIKGVFNINAINTTEYGFILTTINARDARLQGHLKIILNQNKRVEALIFRRSPDEKEMIFFLPFITRQELEKERAYYTDWGEMELPVPDSIWGKTFVPFYRLHRDLEVQERLTPKDKTTIRFEEIITYETVVTPVEKESPETEMEETEETAKQKSKEEKKPAKVEITLALPLDSIDTDSLQVLKHKETRTYFMELNTTLFYDDGTSEAKTMRYEIKKVKEREDELAAMDENRFLWEVTSPEAKAIQLYLTRYRTLVAVDIDEKKYTVRGY